MLDALLENTPMDHPDREEIPTVRQILAGALRGSKVRVLTPGLKKVTDGSCSPA